MKRTWVGLGKYYGLGSNKCRIYINFIFESTGVCFRDDSLSDKWALVQSDIFPNFQNHVHSMGWVYCALI